MDKKMERLPLNSHALAVAPLPQLRRIVEDAENFAALEDVSQGFGSALVAIKSFLSTSAQSQGGDKHVTARVTTGKSSPLKPAHRKRAATEAAIGTDDDGDVESRGKTDMSRVETRRLAHLPSQSSTSVAVLPSTSSIDVPPDSLTSTKSPFTAATSKRSRSAAKETKNRDNNLCVLTGVCMPDAAHIFSFSATASDLAQQQIDKMLIFWGSEVRDTWRAAFLNRAVSDSPQNLFSLGKHMHCMWDRALFALKPLSATDREVTVQFYWLKCSKKVTSGEFGSFDAAMQAVCGGDTRGWGPPQLAHRPSGLRIETGQLFTIRADMPEQLPSMDLLVLQWNLLRISAMCGAADVYDGDEGDEDDCADGSVHLVSDLAKDPLPEEKKPVKSSSKVGEGGTGAWSSSDRQPTPRSYKKTRVRPLALYTV
ncbi:hypothetical protein SEPCBS57363_005675 [Sporothrix epigloea]|uniref:HNH nuclease domain-containing protein n=1 Tax=Sporothrix epigloea TaxID=1892477 RepID=A0ABP0E2T9_9PEZI